MPGQSQLDLPGDFEAGKKYLVSGDTLLAWQRNLIADRVIPGVGLEERETQAGRSLNVLRTDNSCAYTVTLSHSEGKIYVSYGTTAVTDNDSRILVPVVSEINGVPLDAATPPSFDLPGSGTHEIWLYFSREKSEVILIDSTDPLEEPAPGSFWLKIYDFTIGESSLSENQIRCGHVEVVTKDEKSSSSGSDSDDDSAGGDPSDSGDPSSSGESKSTAILKTKIEGHPTGFHAFYVTEAPEARFIDQMRGRLKGRVTRWQIPFDYFEQCEPGTLEVAGWSCAKPIPLGVDIDGDAVVITQPWLRRVETARVSLTAIRWNHFYRCGLRTEQQFHKNNASIRAMY